MSDAARYPPPPSPDYKSNNVYGTNMPPQPPPAHHHGVMQETEEELTEEEREAYESGIMTWDKAKNWRFWFRKEWIWYYVLLVIIIVVVALMAFFHKDIVKWLTPFVKKLQSVKYGWLIPVAIIFALSIPPLFGNEIVMVLVGLVWGLGRGFAIPAEMEEFKVGWYTESKVAVGTFLGEMTNFLIFRYWCRTRAEKMARKSLNWACLCQAIADGGFPMALLVRLSAVPTHFTTVVFAVCGLAIWKFVLALILGLPKQLIAVYVGVVLGEDQDGTTSTNSHIISDSVFGVTALLTIISLFIIYRKMMKVRKKVLLSMRKDLQSKHINVSAMPDEGAGGGANGYVPTAAPEQVNYGTSYGSYPDTNGQPGGYATAPAGQDPAYAANQYQTHAGIYSPNAPFQPSTKDPRANAGYLSAQQGMDHRAF